VLKASAYCVKVHIGPGVSLFDVIETDDNETLSWEEFRKFFDDRAGKVPCTELIHASSNKLYVILQLWM
jgi:hypothetical protein